MSVRVLTARALEGVPHAFATRLGGVSEGAFRSLNLGRATDDRPEAVDENHRRLAAAVGFAPDALRTPDRQVHGDLVHTVADGAAATGDCDGLASGHPGTWIGIRTADCVPILLWDRDSGAVAAVHAGWRGIAAGIPRGGVATLATRFGADPARIVAAIGPAIDACCYEVDDATAAQLSRAAPGFETRPAQRSGHVFAGLRSAVERQLVSAGLRADALERVGGCTSCDAELFFSHRRDRGVTGRMLSLIAPPGRGTA